MSTFREKSCDRDVSQVDATMKVNLEQVVAVVGKCKHRMICELRTFVQFELGDCQRMILRWSCSTYSLHSPTVLCNSCQGVIRNPHAFCHVEALQLVAVRRDCAHSLVRDSFQSRQVDSQEISVTLNQWSHTQVCQLATIRQSQSFHPFAIRQRQYCSITNLRLQLSQVQSSDKVMVCKESIWFPRSLNNIK